MSFPNVKQANLMDCGPTCVQMICMYYGKILSIQYLRSVCGLGKQGVSLLGISDAAASVGFNTLPVTVTLFQLVELAKFPCIVHWEQNHFVVVYKIHRDSVYVSDPSIGKIRYSKREFIEGWCNAKDQASAIGIALLLEPTQSFFEQCDHELNKTGYRKISGYLHRYRRLLLLLLVGSFLGSVLQLLLPYITQTVVDAGVIGKNISLIFLFLLAQLAIIVGNSMVDFTRSWILLYISTRISLSLLSEFWTKLLRIPVSYVEKRSDGEILQLVTDHNRIDSFLTGPAITIFFSISSFLVLSTVLLSYNGLLFSLFITGTLIYSIWILLFLKARKKIDVKKFAISARTQSLMVQLIHGIHDIRISNSEVFKVNQWGNQQVSLFNLSAKSLRLSQLQQGGGVLISQLTFILISFFSARFVVSGDLTLGAMLAIQLIVGQLTSPVMQTINFVQSLQDSRLSLDRINDVHDTEEEEPAHLSLHKNLPEKRDIRFENVSFSYSGSGDECVLRHINLVIPSGKVTAIVGASGSGKTTLLKILLMFHSPTAGKLNLGDTSFSKFSPSFWRSRCGVVMQEGFLFNDTIEQNIAVGIEKPCYNKLLRAAKAACIEDFIESLPLRYQTVIGPDGIGLSQGQKQRILIARAVFKDPDFVFLDEATNALDTVNEQMVMNNLRNFYKDRTVVVVAHRLSTVVDADQIIVLKDGRIEEVGNHYQLSRSDGHYYRLVRNQLELER